MMQYLFDDKNLRSFESFLSDNTLYGFDFDGTLAPIVENRNEACMSVATEELVQALMNKEIVAFITGRSRSDIEALTALRPHYLIGNHGSEGLLNEQASGELLGRTKKYKEIILKNYSAQLSILGIDIEDKGFSLSLHYRKSSKPDEAGSFLTFLKKSLPGAKFVEGKLVMNVLPESAMSKGDAFLAIMKKEKTKSGFYVGDDITDEDVFSLKDPRIVSVRVGQNAFSEASYFIKDQSEINLLLSSLLKFKG